MNSEIRTPASTTAARIAASLLTALTLTPVCSGQGEQAAVPRPLQSFEQLEAEFDRVWGDWRASNTARARGSGDGQSESADPTPRFIPKFQEGAARHAGTEPAFDYLQWILSRAWRFDRDATLSALDQLLRDHADDARMPRVAFSLALRARRDGFPRQRALDAQELIADAAKSPEGKAEALFWRSYVVAGTESEDAEKERALRDLSVAAETGDARIQRQAEGLMFELTRLQVGMLAPEIEAEDLDGIPFRLSDYRGKVVLLDFWGDW